jgi:hypothetical protein
MGKQAGWNTPAGKRMQAAQRKAVNTRSRIPRDAVKESYTAKYDRQTLEQGKVLRENGTTTTVRAGGIESDGMVYTVPFYNRDTGVVEDYHGAAFRAKEDIKTGKVAGYSEDWGVPIKEHPANISAAIEHKSIVEKRK